MADPQTETMVFDGDTTKSITGITSNLWLMAIGLPPTWDESEDVDVWVKIRSDQPLAAPCSDTDGPITFTGDNYTVDDVAGGNLILGGKISSPITELKVVSSGAQTGTVYPRLSRLKAV